MAPPSEILAQFEGKVVPYSFNPGFICLSYFISLIGALSTLELVSRRTSHKGLYNQLIIIGAAISMGGISIWSMHFIGNRAIYINHGEADLQIGYSVKMNVISLFLPILVLGLAFLVSSDDRTQWWRTGLAGVLAGAAVCGMHYLGNASIENYRCEYRLATIIGAAVIAVVASTTALAVFFVLQAAWKAAWWRKILCAMLLAAGVSGMHWCAAAGTKYRLLHLHTGKNDMSRGTTITIVICLSIGACIILVASAAYSARTRRHYATKAQQIAVAAVIFDKQGRILVNQEGLLLTEVIADRFLQESDRDAFGVQHPLFLWMFQASRGWTTITNFLESMRRHMDQTPGATRDGGLHLKAAGQGAHFLETYRYLFKERFCLAASALAAKTNDTLQSVGVLWDEICPTGASAWTLSDAEDRRKRADYAEKGLSQGSQATSRGSLMFLVRHVDSRDEARRLEATGCRFVDIRQVVGIIMSNMQIQTPNFGEKLESMAAYDERKAMYAPGVHLGLFAIRAQWDYTGFAVLVDKYHRGILPTVHLPCDQLEQPHLDVLAQLDGLKMSESVQKMEDMLKSGKVHRRFITHLRDAVVELAALLGDPVFGNAIFNPKTVQVPCSPGKGNARLTTTLISVRLILDIHSSTNHAKFSFVPLQLLKAHQLVFDGSPHQIEFSHKLHRELSSILATVPLVPSNTSTRRSSALQWMPKLSRPTKPKKAIIQQGPSIFTTSQEWLSVSSDISPSPLGPRDCSSVDMTDAGSPPAEQDIALKRYPRSGSQSHFGGIMVSQQVTINVDSGPHDPEPHFINHGRNTQHIYPEPSRTVVAVAIDKEEGNLQESPTFVDELMSMFKSDTLDKS